MARRKVREAKSLKRGKNTIPFTEVVWVYCEGKTEATLLDQCRQKFRGRSVKVESEVGDPKTIIEKARKQKKKAPDDSVFVVFDHDARDQFSTYVQQAEEANLKLGISIPCVEVWAILLHEEQNAELTTKAAQTRLKKLHPQYCHTKNPIFCFDTVCANFLEAYERELKLQKTADEAEECFRNPITTFGRMLIEIFPAINNSTKK